METQDFSVFQINRTDPRWSELAIWAVDQPPEELFIQGKESSLELLNRLPQDGFSVVGTRRALPKSLHLTRTQVRELRNSGLIVISGFALGIDTAAHEAAIDAGLPTIAILAGGILNTYPPENMALRRTILNNGGLFISQYPGDTQPKPTSFLLRNRLISGWSLATWIVEASQKSGALNTARWARDQNRISYATPCFPGDTCFAGNQTLIDRDHAVVYWGTHSLGQVWMRLAAQNENHRRPVRHVRTERIGQLGFEHPDAIALSVEVCKFTSIQGGAHVQQILDWALTQEWRPERFFQALQDALSDELIHDENGFLVGRSNV